MKIYLYTILIFISFLFSCTPPGYIREGREIVFYEDRRDEIVQTARNYIGVRYKNGGKTPDGFDCSGFTMFAYKENGYDIPRKATSQYFSGHKITLRSAKPGDLVFFNISGSRISHVGIYLGNNSFIHSPSPGKSVSYASMDNYWGKRYTGAITYFKD